MKRLGVLLFVVVLVAAACGDSGTDTSAPAATSGDTQPASTEPAATEAPAPMWSPATTSGDTIPATIGDIPGVSDDCEALANVFLSFASIFSPGGINIPDTDAFGDLPGDVQDDAEIVIDALSEWAQGLADAGIDLSDPNSLATLTEAQQNELERLSQAFDTDEINDALDRLGEYGEQECDTFTP